MVSELRRRQGYILTWQQHGATVLGCDFWGHPVAVSIDGQADWCDVSLSHTFPHVRELRKLSIANVTMSMDDMRWIGSQSNLTYLSLEGCSLPTGSLVHINGLQEMRLINLSHTNVTNKDLCHLSTMRNLTALFLDGTTVNASGIQSLGELSQLELLSLCGTPISDDAVPLLKRLSSLRVLCIRHTMISTHGQQDLAESMPHVRFESLSDRLDHRRAKSRGGNGKQTENHQRNDAYSICTSHLSPDPFLLATRHTTAH